MVFTETIISRKTLKILIIIILISIISKVNTDESWCYEKSSCGPLSWAKISRICATGFKQSPINIVTSKVKTRLQSTRLVLNRNYVIPKSFYLQNNGHTVQLSVKQDTRSKCYMVGDGLGKSPYYFAQLHFHWGPNNLLGSEHRISGKSYPLEMHMVHKLVKNENKVAVLSVLFYLSPRDNMALGPILSNINKVKSPNEAPVLIDNSRINLTALLPKRMRMFRYIGSLTTPPCTENVVWTVFRDPLPVSRKQMAKFRTLLGFDNLPMKRTFRPIQPTFTKARKNVYFLKQNRRSRVVGSARSSRRSRGIGRSRFDILDW